MKKSYSVTELMFSTIFLILFLSILAFLVIWLVDHILIAVAAFLVVVIAYAAYKNIRRLKLAKLLRKKLDEQEQEQ